MDILGYYVCSIYFPDAAQNEETEKEALSFEIYCRCWEYSNAYRLLEGGSIYTSSLFLLIPFYREKNL